MHQSQMFLIFLFSGKKKGLIQDAIPSPRLDAKAPRAQKRRVEKEASQPSDALNADISNVVQV
jgi:hypothetical protein